MSNSDIPQAPELQKGDPCWGKVKNTGDRVEGFYGGEEFGEYLVAHGPSGTGLNGGWSCSEVHPLPSPQPQERAGLTVEEIEKIMEVAKEWYGAPSTGFDATMCVEDIMENELNDLRSRLLQKMSSTPTEQSSTPNTSR